MGSCADRRPGHVVLENLLERGISAYDADYSLKHGLLGLQVSDELLVCIAKSSSGTTRSSKIRKDHHSRRQTILGGPSVDLC